MDGGPSGREKERRKPGRSRAAWGPKFFSDVFGQEEALARLSRSIQQGRVANSYLFAGPEGVGKKRVALDMARVLLCERPKGAKACGSCRSCRYMSSIWHLHPTLLVIEDVSQPLPIERAAIMRLCGFGPSEEDRYLDAAKLLGEIGVVAFSPSLGRGPDQVDLFLREGASVFDKSESALVSEGTVGTTLARVERAVSSGLEPRALRLAEMLLANTTEGLYQNTIKVGQIRSQLQARLANRPLYGKRHICVIDDAHNMQEPAQNSLLKTLEEPVPGAVIILITDNPSALLPTVLSRCQLVTFKRLPEEFIDRFLRQRRGIKDRAATAIASYSGGSLGRAISVDADRILHVRGVVEKLLGYAQSRDAESLLVIAGLVALETEQSRAVRRRWALQVLDTLSAYIRDAILIKQSASPDSIINKDSAEKIATFAKNTSLDELFAWSDSVAATKEKIEANADIRLAVEAMFAQRGLFAAPPQP